MYLGIDPSLRSTGVVLLNGEGNLLKSWNFKTKEHDGPLPARMAMIRNYFTDVWDYIQQNMTVKLESVAIETPFIGHNKLTAHILSAVWGSIACQVFQWMPDRLLEVHPSLVKRFATGRPIADKTDMAIAAVRRWKFDDKCDDIVDAYVLAHIARCQANPKLPDYDEKQKNSVREYLRLKNAARGSEDS